MDTRLNDRLQKLLRLYYNSAATDGERQAAAVAIRKIQDRLRAVRVYDYPVLKETKNV